MLMNTVWVLKSIMADHHHRHKGSIYGLNTVVGLGQKMASSKYEHKSYDAFKVSPKILGLCWLAWECSPISTHLHYVWRRGSIWNTDSRAEAEEVFMGHFSRAVSWSGDYGISLPFSFLLIFFFAELLWIVPHDSRLFCVILTHHFLRDNWNLVLDESLENLANIYG